MNTNLFKASSSSLLLLLHVWLDLLIFDLFECGLLCNMPGWSFVFAGLQHMAGVVGHNNEWFVLIHDTVFMFVPEFYLLTL